MKKRFFVSFFVMILSCLGLVFADEYEDASIANLTSYNENLYINSLDMGFTDYESRLEYYAIEQDVLEACSTEDLMELMLSCPLLCNISVYNTREEGLESLVRDFEYFEEYLNRDDAFDVAISAYESFLIPSDTILDYDDLISETSYVDDVNTLARDRTKSLYVQRDARVNYSVSMLETLIRYLSKDRTVTDDEMRRLDEAISRIRNKESASKYYGYGRELSDFASGEIDILEEIEMRQNPFSIRRIIDNLLENTRYTVTTPSGTNVTATYTSTLTYNNVTECTNLAASYGATFYSPSTKQCNCHSYAWLSGRSTYSSLYRHIKLNNTSAFRSDSYYTYESSPSVVGEIGDSGNNSHSEVVYAFNVHNSKTGLYETQYISKWGLGGIYIHFHGSGFPYSGLVFGYYKH